MNMILNWIAHNKNLYSSTFQEDANGKVIGNEINSCHCQYALDTIAFIFYIITSNNNNSDYIYIVDEGKNMTATTL